MSAALIHPSVSVAQQVRARGWSRGIEQTTHWSSSWPANKASGGVSHSNIDDNYRENQKNWCGPIDKVHRKLLDLNLKTSKFSFFEKLKTGQ
jgi:hypothetical protein